MRRIILSSQERWHVCRRMTHLNSHLPIARCLSLSLLALGLLSPASVRAFEWDGAQLAAADISGEAPNHPMVTAIDLDRNGSTERVVLAHGRMAIVSGASILWMSPAEWTVTQAMLADLDHDGTIEASLIVWRPFSPWPIDAWLPHGGRINTFHDGSGQSCHLILVGWRNGHWQERWAGSALAEPLIQFEAADMDGDGNKELLALEGRYAGHGSKANGSLGVWRWNGFGFTLVSRAAGRFSQFHSVTMADGRTRILAQEAWR